MRRLAEKSRPMDNHTPKECSLNNYENVIADQERVEGNSPLQWSKPKRIGHVVLVSVLTLVMYNLLLNVFSSRSANQLDIGSPHRRSSRSMDPKPLVVLWWCLLPFCGKLSDPWKSYGELHWCLAFLMALNSGSCVKHTWHWCIADWYTRSQWAIERVLTN